ncbi:MAG: carbohydrate-binding family 9-like protein, partial [Bacteroidota bacterium]|nr:carbohydrate-binding family 9-like protein [Bacteroidota bacterium]
MKKDFSVFPIMLIIMILGCSRQDQNQSDIQQEIISEPELMFSPENYICYKTGVPILIDGDLNEAAWDKVGWTAEFKDIEGNSKPAPRYKTRAKMLWDNTYLYISAELEEPEIWATLRQRDTLIYYDNDFEVFIDPDGDTHNYYEFEVNAFGTEWDLLLAKPYRDGGPAISAWDINGIKLGVKIYGTINDPANKDEKWTLEIAMPWDILKECAPGKRKPVAGEQWRMNFSRVEWDVEIVDGKYVKKKDTETGRNLPENNWVWSPQGLINMHFPEFWAYVQFSGIVAGTGLEEFRVNPDEEVKWKLRLLYYKQKKYYTSNGL